MKYGLFLAIPVVMMLLFLWLSGHTRKRRLMACTIMGAVCGGLCVLLSTSSGALALPIVWAIFTGRMLIGFVIGISTLKLPWAIHGSLMGLIVGLPSAVGAMSGASAEFTLWTAFTWTLIMGMIYGFIIEYVVSVLLKARQTKPQ